MPTIFYSTEDPAGINIAENLKKFHSFSKSDLLHNRFPSWKNPTGAPLIELDVIPIETDFLEQFFHDDFFIFATRHASASGKKSFTTHITGNWGNDASHGGKPKQLAYPLPLQMKSVLQFLQANNKWPDFEVVYEATHHGPTSLTTPLLFIEIGSTDAEWTVPEYGKLIADAIMHILTSPLPTNQKIAVGVGGIHYEREFTKKALSSDVAMGHMAAKYSIEQLDAKMLAESLKKSNASIILIEWKSLKAPEREKVIHLCEDAGIKWEKI